MSDTLARRQFVSAHVVIRAALTLAILVSAAGPTVRTARAGNLPPIPDDTVTNGDAGPTAFTTGDPISAATGEYTFSTNLLDLGGLMPLRFDLYYGSLIEASSDLSIAGHFINLPDRFSHNLSPWLAEYPFTDPPTVYAYLGMGREVGFRQAGSGWQVLDEEPVRYQLQKAAGPSYFLLDPARGWVYVFGDCFGGSDIAMCQRPSYITDRNGNRLTFGENSVSDGLGRELRFTLEPFARFSPDMIVRVQDQNGREVALGYEANPEDNPDAVTLRSITDPMGNVTTFRYSGGYLAATERPAGNIPYTQAYNPDYRDHGVVATQTDAYANVMRLDPDEFSIDYTTADEPSAANPWTFPSREVSEDSQFTVTYPDGSQRVFQHGSGSRVVSGLTDETANAAQFQSDPAHPWITAVTDRLGDTTAFTYHPETGNLASVTNAKGETVSFTYTPQEQTFADAATFTFYNLTRVDYPDGTRAELAYDERGNVLGRTDPSGATWAYTYNERGQMLTATNPSGGVATFAYNDDATLASLEDAETGVTAFGYDDFKRLDRITLPGGAAVGFTYDLLDRVTSVTDENGNTTEYEYDANGNLIRITDPSGQTVGLTYDLMDRLAGFTDRLGSSAAMAYDPLGRIASLEDPTGVETAFGYDPRGWLNAVTAAGQTWTTEYDAEGVPASTTTPLGHTTSYRTDALGLLAALTDPLGNTTTFTRDALGRITAVIDPLERTTEYGYDANGRLISAGPPGLGKATYTRDGLGLLTALSDLNGQTWSFGHTPMGRLASAADPLGNTSGYTYDERGRLTAATLADGGTLNYTYDAAGNLTGIQDPSGLNLAYTYDSLNRLTQTNGLALEYDVEGRITGTRNSPSPLQGDGGGGWGFGATYDAAGRVQTVTYEGGLTVTYTYDPATGLLTGVTDNLSNAKVEFAYDADRYLTGVSRSNGVNTELTWDAAGRLTGLRDGEILNLQYTLDAAGQVTNVQITAPLDPASSLQPPASSFQYDAASQLAGDGYEHDAQGRLTASPDGTFQWDAASRLVAVDDVALSYNALGDLTSRRTSDQSPTTNYHYNYALGLHPIVAEQDGESGDFSSYYVWAPNGALLYAIEMNGSEPRPSFYHFDRTGSTLALTDADGVVTDAYAYDTYGQLLAHQGDSAQPFTFVGEWGVRREGDHYQVRARYYDPVTARFLSRDPFWPQIGDGLQLNPYAYAHASPVNYGDVNGAEVLNWGNVVPGTEELTVGQALTGQGGVFADAGDVLATAQAQGHSIRIGGQSLVEQRVVPGTGLTLERWPGVGGNQPFYRVVETSTGRVLQGTVSQAFVTRLGALAAGFGIATAAALLSEVFWYGASELMELQASTSGIAQRLAERIAERQAREQMEQAAQELEELNRQLLIAQMERILAEIRLLELIDARNRQLAGGAAQFDWDQANNAVANVGGDFLGRRETPYKTVPTLGWGR